MPQVGVDPEAEVELPVHSYSKRKYLDTASFAAALDQFALVYAACGALSYSAALGHKR